MAATRRRFANKQTDSSIIQAVIESSTRDPAVLEKVARELRAFPWTESVDWTEIESE